MEIYELLPVSIVYSFIEMIKRVPYFKCDKTRKWLPAVSALSGIISGIFVSFLIYGFDAGIRQMLLRGIIYGLIASGAFSWYKQTKQSGGTI